MHYCYLIIMYGLQHNFILTFIWETAARSSDHDDDGVQLPPSTHGRGEGDAERVRLRRVPRLPPLLRIHFAVPL